MTEKLMTGMLRIKTNKHNFSTVILCVGPLAFSKCFASGFVYIALYHIQAMETVHIKT